MITYQGLSKYTVKDVRIAIVEDSLAYSPHQDTKHKNSLKDSTTLYIIIWISCQYIPGNTSSGLQAKVPKIEDFWDNTGFIKGRFSEFECWYDKDKLNFLFKDEINKCRCKRIKYFSDVPATYIKNRIEKSQYNMDKKTGK